MARREKMPDWVKQIKNMHTMISATNRSTATRLAAHQKLGEVAETLVDGDGFRWGFGDPEDCLSKAGRHEQVKGVYGLFWKADIKIEQPIISFWSGEIPDAETEYVVENSDGYFYVRASLGGYYRLVGKIIACKGTWMRLALQREIPEGRILFDASGYEFLIQDFDDLGEYDPADYLREYWDTRFGRVSEDAADEYRGDGFDTDRYNPGTLARRIKCAEADGYTILGVLHEPLYVWEGRVFVAPKEEKDEKQL